MKALVAAGKVGTLMKNVETVSVRHPKAKLEYVYDFKGFYNWILDAAQAARLKTCELQV